jgi:hypothetical protein
MKGDRHNENKPKWSLVPQSALIPMVKVLEYGTQKYAPYNWVKGLPITEICESLKRHLDAFMEGEDNDIESKLSHIGHIQCNALFLSWMMEHRPDLDDRHKYKVNREDETIELFELKPQDNFEDFRATVKEHLIKAYRKHFSVPHSYLVNRCNQLLDVHKVWLKEIYSFNDGINDHPYEVIVKQLIKYEINIRRQQ